MGRPAVRQDRAFVGRQAELQVLADLVDGGVGCVGYLHGIAGIGKSVLLSRCLRLARDAGVGVVALDCRAVEPTERGVLQATGRFQDVVELGRHLASLPSPTVLALDHCESAGRPGASVALIRPSPGPDDHGARSGPDDGA